MGIWAELFVFQTISASFKSNQTGTAHFQNAIGLQQLNKSVDLGGCALDFNNQSLLGEVDDHPLRT